MLRLQSETAPRRGCRFLSVRIVRVAVDGDRVAGEARLQLLGDGPAERALVVDREVREHVEAQELSLLVAVDPMGAERALVPARRVPDQRTLGGVRGVDGVDADGEEDMELLEHGLLDVLGQAVQPTRVGVGVDLDMHRADGGVGAVVVQHKVEGAEHAGHGGDGLLDRFRDLTVGALAHDVADRVEQHFQTGLEDEDRDDRAERPVEIELEEQHDQRAHKGRGGDDRVEAGVRAGGDERVGIVLLALGLDIAAEQELDHDGHGHDDQRERAVVGLRGGEDLLDRLDQRGRAGGEDDGRDEHGAEILHPPVAEGVLVVRRPLGELDAEDRDDRAHGVGEVVDRVEDDGDRAGEQPDHRLEGGEQDICDDADHAGPGDLLRAEIAVGHDGSQPFVKGAYREIIARRRPPRNRNRRIGGAKSGIEKSRAARYNDD